MDKKGDKGCDEGNKNGMDVKSYEKGDEGCENKNRNRILIEEVKIENDRDGWIGKRRGDIWDIGKFKNKENLKKKWEEDLIWIMSKKKK